MNLREIKKLIPDALVQKITLSMDAGKDEKERQAKNVADLMETGLIYFDWNCNKMNVYTSYDFKEFLKVLKPGMVLKAEHCRLGREFKIESEPFVSGTFMAVRANNDIWFCYTLYHKEVDYKKCYGI